MMCEIIVNITVTAPSACHFVPLYIHRDTVSRVSYKVLLLTVGAVKRGHIHFVAAGVTFPA